MTPRWDNPVGQIRAAVIVQHGFARSARHLSGVAGALADGGCVVARPELRSLTPRHSLHDPGFLDRLGEEVIASARRRAAGAPVIGLGHSAGAAVVAGWADRLDGLVLADPVDRHGRIDALTRTPPRAPLFVVTADPSRCNRHGRAADLLAESGLITPGGTWTRIPGSSHADPERIPASLSPVDVREQDRWVGWACGRGGSASIVCEWGRALLRAVESIAPGA